MEVTTEREDGTLVALVTGRIDGSTARDFESRMTDVIGDDDRAVIIDLNGVTYISSAGLRAILVIAKDLWKRNAKFALYALGESITEVFTIAGFHKVVTICESKAEALAATSG